MEDKKIGYSEMIKTGKLLLSEDNENGEYDRAIAEFICDCFPTTIEEVERDLGLTKAICSECGQSFSNHNDDGSCVDDEVEKEAIRKEFDRSLAHADFLYDQMKERELTK